MTLEQRDRREHRQRRPPARTPEQRGQRREQQAVAGQVVAGVPVLVPDREPEMREQADAVDLRREIGRARIDEQPHGHERRGDGSPSSPATRARLVRKRPAPGALPHRTSADTGRTRRRIVYSGANRRGGPRSGSGSDRHARIMTAMRAAARTGRLQRDGAARGSALCALVRGDGRERLRDRPPAADRRAGRSPKPRRSPTTGSTGSAHASSASRSPRADGQKGYISTVGDSVYYGDCVHGKGIFGGGSCLLPLQVTTVIYRLHSNATLGPAAQHRRARGAGDRLRRRALDRALQRAGSRSTSSPTRSPTRSAAANELRPLNAPGSASGDLPPPVVLPRPRREAIGRESSQRVMQKPARARLPARAAAAIAFAKSLS